MMPTEAQVMEPEVEDLIPPQRPFTAQDRCDRCSAQAFIRTLHVVDVETSLPLEWCKHHFTEHIEALDVFVVHDESHRL